MEKCNWFGVSTRVVKASSHQADVSAQWFCIYKYKLYFFLSDLYNLYRDNTIIYNQCYIIYHILYYILLYMCYVTKIFFRLISFVNLFNFWPKKMPGFPCLFWISRLLYVVLLGIQEKNMFSNEYIWERKVFVWPPHVLENTQESCLLLPQI